MNNMTEPDAAQRKLPTRVPLCDGPGRTLEAATIVLAALVYRAVAARGGAVNRMQEGP